MKVCFISGSYPPILCGVGDYVQRLAHALAQQGIAVEVLTSKQGPPARDGDVLIRPVVQRWGMRALPGILAQLRAIAPDVVNIEYPTQRYGRQPLINLLPLFIRAQKIPVVTTIHEFGTFRRLGQWRIALSALTSNRVVVPDPINLLQMGRAFPYVRSKLDYVPLAPNIEPHLAGDFDRARERASFGASGADVVIAYFGFISPSKGVDLLLRAFERASLHASDTRLRLLLVANREPSEPAYAGYHRQIQEQLDRSAVRERVYWTGYCPPAQVSAYLAAADMAVLPFADGASLRRTTLLTVLAHGLPVVSTIAPGTAGTELNEEHGVSLVPLNDEMALAQAIVDLAGDRSRREACSMRAKDFANGFSWTNIAGQMMAVYNKVLGV